MVVQLDPKHVQQPGVSLEAPSKALSQNHTLYHSTLASGKDNIVVEYFWKACDTVKWVFTSTWSWMVWLCHGCPVEASKLDIMEEIFEAPEAKGKELAKSPQAAIAEIVAAVFDDPAEFKSLLEKDKNQEKFDKFLKAFKEKIEDESSLFSKARGVFKALEAFVYGKSSSNNVFKFLVALLKDNTSLTTKVLENVSAQVLKVTQTEAETSSNERNALIGVFGSYVPKVIQAANDNPAGMQKFIEEFFKQRSFNSDTTVQLIHDHLYPQPIPEELAQLNTCFGNEALVLQQLGESHLLEVDGPSIDLRKAFLKELVKAMEAEHIDSFKKIIEKESKLGGEILKHFVEFIASPDGKEKFTRNLPKALPVLEKLYTDYQSK